MSEAGGKLKWEKMMLTFEEYVEQSQRATTVQQLKMLFSTYLGNEGYENHIFTSVAAGQVGAVAWYEFPEGYAETYLKEGWAAADPVLAHTLTAERPFRWVDVCARDLPRQATAVLDHCRELKVHSGITFPLGQRAQRRDVVSISQRERTDCDPSRLFVIRAICAQTWWRLADITATQSSTSQEQMPRLTRREIEFLTWVKHGKSNPEIAEISGVSKKTVEFHLTNAMTKLRASNRITAVVIAIQNGLVEL